MQKNKWFVFFLLLLLSFLPGCAKKYFSEKIKHSPSIALYYQKGDIIITGERKNYGRHGTSVSVKKRFYETIPDSFEKELTRTVLKSIQEHLPGSAVRILEKPPQKTVRTIKGKTSIDDFSAVEEDLLVLWQFDINYSCKQSYFMDKCDGVISGFITLQDTDKKTKKNILSYKRPL
ncbi:MAG: hypothetical protein OEZ34_15120, partial [Spirochaetia bacterium]|nr:hypothetical protein [Spirochaetia bacterium]